MDIAGFAGFAERGPLPGPVADEFFDPLTVAVRLTGWDDYRAQFGGFSAYGYLPYAVRAFFENGGSECYVVRVAATTAEDLDEQPRAAIFPAPGEIAGSPVALTAAAAKGDLIVKAAPGAVEATELLAFTGQGLTEYIPAARTAADGSIYLARPLETAYPAGSSFERYRRAFLVSAASAGDWGNRVALVFTPLEFTTNVNAFALRVRVAPGPDLTAPDEEEFYPRLSLDPAAADFAPDTINRESRLIRIDIAGNISPAGLLAGSGPLTAGRIWLSGGRDGLKKVTSRDFTGGPGDFRGLTVLEKVDEVGILCAPDAVWAGIPDLPPPPPPPAPDPCAAPPPGSTPAPAPDSTAIPPAMDTASIYQTMIGQCYLKRYRTCILDLPERTPVPQAGRWAGDQQLLSEAARFAAIYFPWIKAPDPLSPYETTRSVPCGGHVAGAYASTDHSAGVQKPPANVRLHFAVDTVQDVTDLQQGPLNEAGVNVLREIPGRGIRVWGARSLAAAIPFEADWKFIHVRRLLSAIEASVERSTQWAVFQPNNFSLRNTLAHSISVLLESIWERGGLKGATAGQSFFVRCDETNNPPAVVDAGQLICRVGVAVAAPMEFLVFELRQDVEGSDLVEV